MGRSSAEQAAQNRTRIVEAASRLFRENGVEAVSVADVMAAVDMTVGGFYKHFASKEALVEEAAGLAFEQAIEVWNKVFASTDRDAADLRARLIANYLRPDPKRHCPIIAFAPHAASGNASAAARGTYDRGTGALLEKFFAGPHSGDGQPDPDTLLLFAAMIGARVLGEAAGDAPWLGALRAAVIDAAARAGKE